MQAIAPVIRIDNLTKRYGSVTAVSGLSFTAQPGRVLGLLGPNGSGKTTTLRMLLGLAKPTAGVALIGGRAYRSYGQPVRVIGATLEANSFHPGRTGRNHLRVMAAAAGIPLVRVDEVLDIVGLGGDGKRRVKEYSLGMRQRLGLAAALLGDPGILALDEPINGLDPEGIRWIRELLRHLAGEGRTILVSSHVLSEVAQTVDDVVIINRGVSVFAGGLTELERLAGSSVVVDSPTPDRLISALQAAGQPVRVVGDVISVDGSLAPEVGHIAFASGIELSQLREQRASLEDVFMGIIHESSQLLAAGTYGQPAAHAAREPDGEVVDPYAGSLEGPPADVPEPADASEPDISLGQDANGPRDSGGAQDAIARDAVASEVPPEPEPQPRPESGSTNGGVA